ncbi:MAG: arginine--tRNA ligase [Vicingaceae bacterium]
MSKLNELLVKALVPIFEEQFGQAIEKKQIQLQATRKDFVGDITVVVFPLLRWSKKSPEETGEILGKALTEHSELVRDFNVVKGFLNLVIDQAYWLHFFKEKTSTASFGFAPPKSKGRKMVEYASPNTNKPLHLGHLRNIFLGHSLAEILKANGHEVFKVQIINDRGIHICKSMLAWLKFGEGQNPQSVNIKGDHLVGKYYVEFDKHFKKQVAELMKEGKTEEEAKKEAPIQLEAQEMLRKWEEGDEEVRALWAKMNGWVYQGFEKTYQTIGTSFDKLYYESDTFLLGKEIVLKHEKSTLLYRKEDNSIWADLSAEKLDDKLLLRSDGTSVYMTQDIGTAVKREEEYSCENYFYVVGNEQDYHFKVLAILLQKMGYSWANGIEHLSYGMVDLPSGKMKSREGTVVDADDLMEEMKQTAADISQDLGKVDSLSEKEKNELFHTIGMGALKYFILKVDPKKRMLFDPQESVDFNGHTGPFIQYAHARIQSIVRKAGRGEWSAFSTGIEVQKEDIELIKALHDFPTVVEEAGLQKSPALIANYVFELVKAFNHFYQNTPPIIKEENLAIKNFRLCLSEKVGQVIQQGMRLLGINVPDRM